MEKDVFLKNNKSSAVKNLNTSHKNNEQKRLENQIKSYRNSNNLNSSNSLKTPNGNKNNNKMKNLENKVTNKVASAGLSAVGVPKPISDAIVNSKAGQKAMEKAKKPRIPGLPGLGLFDNLLGNGKKETEEQFSDGGGQNYKVSIKLIKTLLIASPFILTVVVVCCLLMAGSHIYLNAINIGEADSTSDSDAEDKINKKGDKGLDEEKTDDDLGYDYYINDSSQNLIFVNSITNKKRNNTEADLAELEDFYGDSLKYDENSNMEIVNAFYLKLHDIYIRYNLKLKGLNGGVELDLPLLMSTLMMQSDDINEVFESNTRVKYDRSNIKTIDKSDLDYDQDLSNYKISYKDSSHDIEILCQHMVSVDANGQYYIDYDKYNEFLTEFLEKKYFLDENEAYPQDSANNSDGLNSNNDSSNTQQNVNADWRKWTQCKQSWSNIKIGKGKKDNMCNIGCLVTSISIQIARSGTATTNNKIDPGIAAKTFSFTSDGGLYWGSVSKLAPNFIRKTYFSLVGMKKDTIAQKLLSYDSSKYYIILNVSLKSKNKAHHYVALDYIDPSTSEIYIIDPASTLKTKLYDEYKLYNAHIFLKKD